MKHILVLPTSLRTKLTEAIADESIRDRWNEIGLVSVDGILNKIIEDLNSKYKSLSIVSIREETPMEIKEKIKNTGNMSKFAGYFENEDGYVDALFFYIPPNSKNANDFISMKIMPSIFGVFNGIKDQTKDRHINCMPVFIVSLCTTSRVNNASVKKQIICCETLGFYYHDLFGNSYHDVIGKFDNDGNEITKIQTLNELDELLGGIDNKWFNVDNDNKVLKVLSSTIESSTNVTSDMYRLSLFVIPAIYKATLDNYSVDIDSISDVTGDTAETFRMFVKKIVGG